MGIDGKGQFTFTICNVDTVKTLRELCQSIRQVDSSGPVRVDVDCGWLLNHLGTVEKVVDALVIFSLNGFIPTPVCDGLSRYHSKRATTQRHYKQEKARIESISTRCQLMKVTQQLKCVDLPSERDQLKNTLTDLEKKVKTLERESSKENKATNAFITNLKEEIESRDNTDEANITGGYVEQVLVARFQADSVIAKRALEGKSHLIIGNDSDFLAYVGSSCIQLRDFAVKRQKKNKSLLKYADLKGMELACASRGMYDRMIDTLVKSGSLSIHYCHMQW